MDEDGRPVILRYSKLSRDITNVNAMLAYLGRGPAKRYRPAGQWTPEPQPVTDTKSAEPDPFLPKYNVKMGKLPTVSYEERELWDEAQLLHDRLREMEQRLHRVKAVLAEYAHAIPHQGVRAQARAGMNALDRLLEAMDAAQAISERSEVANRTVPPSRIPERPGGRSWVHQDAN